MKKRFFSVALIATLASSMMLTSCIGSFKLTNKVLTWNKQVGSKFVNELVFVAFWILPVYELSALADLLVLNSIEFWSGSNPVQASTKTIDGKNGRYIVKCDKDGYTITNTADKSVVKFNFYADDNSWTVCSGDKEVKFMQFVDEGHVKMLTPEGDFKTVELSERGVYAYKQMVNSSIQYAMR
ncbi:MAG: DUF3332 domain-containing protein [Bacteroidales bacterium]|nr:DUF3332 domain-containing protein [Bacteroidales bacterium]